MYPSLHFTAGFLFRRKGDEVALIRKERPAWQRGLWNGIGGKIELGENALVAQQREFREETGAVVSDWRHFATLRWDSGSVSFFTSQWECAPRSLTEEEVAWHPVASLDQLAMVSHVRWLIPLALDQSVGLVDFSALS
jgi:8-oxo-dGTP diphosphatase